MGKLSKADRVEPACCATLPTCSHATKTAPQFFSLVSRSAKEMPIAESTNVKWITATMVTI